MKRKIKQILFWIGFYALIAIILIVVLFPVWFLFSTSIKPLRYVYNPFIIFFEPTFEHWEQVLFRRGFTHFLANSLITMVFTTLLGVFSGTLCGYAINRYRIGGRAFPYFLLFLQLTPGFLMMIPLYNLSQMLGLHDTLLILILQGTASSIPFTAWLMDTYFDNVPIEIEEAALLDGCSRLESFFRIVLPISTPGVAVASIFAAIGSWNGYMMPLILTGINAKTLPVLVAGVITDVDIFWGQMGHSAYSYKSQ